MKDRYLAQMDDDIVGLVARARRLAWRYPGYLLTFVRLARYQKKASSIREARRADGLTVPAFMIVSVTRRCNLRCHGCYSHVSAGIEASTGRASELDTANLSRVVREGAELGVSFMLLAGGEPLVRAVEIIGMAGKNPNVIFPVFTNGILIDEAITQAFKKNRNLIPVLSIEGGKRPTDERRGSGVYDAALIQMRRLKHANVLFGVSFTVMKENVGELTSREFISGLIDAGAGVFFYNEYTPIEGGTESLCVDKAARELMLRALQERKRQFDAIFLAFPGDEDKFGGCLSAGRGFVHIAPDGRLEACPFAPFGDSSARDQSLRAALASPTLRAIRSHHDELSETSLGCALWNRREWVEGLLAAGSPDNALERAPDVQPEETVIKISGEVRR